MQDAPKPRAWERSLATLDQKSGYFYEEEPTWMWQELRNTTIPPPPPERVDLNEVVKSISERPPEPILDPLPPRRAKVDRRAFEVSMGINVALGLGVVACLSLILLRPERVVHTPVLVDALRPGPTVDWSAQQGAEALPRGVDAPAALAALAPLDSTLASSGLEPSMAEASGPPQLIVMPPVHIRVPAARTIAPPPSASATASVSAAARAPAPPRPDPALPEHPSRADVAAAMEGIAPSIRDCVTGRGGERVSLFVRFSNTGRVRFALVEDSAAAPAQRSCMARAVRAATVPAFRSSSLSVRYPFVL